MADQDNDNIQRSLKDLKKLAKQQKKAKKKEKKKAKTEKKIAKQEVKLRKKGVFLEDVTAVEEVEEEKPGEFKPEPWVRKSTEEIPYLEKKIDRLAERKESSSLHNMFQEKYGEVLMVPDTFMEYELTEAEKRRLERLRAMDEESKKPVEVKALAQEEEVKAEEEVKESQDAAGVAKPWYHPKQLMLYNKYGKGKGFIKKYLFLLISIIGWFIIIIPRIIIFIIMFIVNKIKGRKTKKAKSAKETKEVASEA